ncbi:MAG: PQQ-binding-like beta-propeller repeat protein [Acidobacteria bacterium]|nr:PQQ-binding-like beta-propeller repeat protein [Acidobacteriota bacterium]
MQDPFARFRNLEPDPVPLMGAEQAWRVTLAVPPSAGGAMDDERVYVPLRDTGVVALDRERGTMAWFRPIATAFPPVVGEDAVFVVTRAGLDALDAATGADRWTTPLGSPVMTPLVFDTGWLIAIVEPGEMVALRAADGQVIWRVPLGAPSAHPAVPGGEAALYLSLADGRVVALALADGRPLWEQKLPGTLSEPAAAADRVFVGSTDNFFYALNAISGRLEWRWRNGGDVIGAASDGDAVYFVSLDNIVRAVNLGNGNQRWKKAAGTRPLLPPRAFGGIVAVPGLAPAMTVFVGRTGAVQGTYDAAGTLIGAPLLDSSPEPRRVTFLTMTRDGVVEAMRSTALMFREGGTALLPALPGRPLAREQMR